MKKIISAAAILVMMVVLVFPTPVFAIADPDSPSQIDQVLVFEDLLEDGDTGVLVNYYIDYAALPTETATEAYFTVFVDTDGVTQLKTSAPYTYPANALKGYRQGLTWIYFTASETVSAGLNPLLVANYDIWVAGNPTLTWVAGPDPPKTVGGIDSWFTSGDPAVLLSQRVLGFAQTLGTAWTMTLIEQTALGNRLTAAGEAYFTNVIPNLRQMAPAAFSSSEYAPIVEDLDYSTSFGATIADGTGTLPVSPLVLSEGLNDVTITGTGTFTVELERGTVGEAEDAVGGAVVTNSPVALVYGTNTITVTLGGTNKFDLTVNLVNTQSVITDTVIGTGFDLSTPAAAFGMTRLMFSGLVWVLITAIICAAFYKTSEKVGSPASSKIMLLLLSLCTIGGTLMGLLSLTVTVVLFIAMGVFIGLMVFFRGSNV